MSKPRETRSLQVVPGGEILEPVPEPTQAEELRAEWQNSISKGEEILLIEPRRWLVEGWLPLNALGVIYAPPATGKSFYALSLALELARGGWWCGYRLERTKVLYVAGERDTDLRDRAHAWKIHYEERLPDYLELLHPRKTPQLGLGTQVEALCQEIKERESRVVVIDTYARATLGLNENDAGETGRIMENLSRIVEATNSGLVLVVHHTNKSGSSGIDSMRGSSALAGAIDIAIQLDTKERGIEAKVTISKSGATPASRFYKLQPVELPELEGWSRSNAVMVEAAGVPYRKQTDKVLLEILEGFDLPDGFTRANTEQVLRIGKSQAGALLKELRESGVITNISPSTGRNTTSKYFLTDKGRERAEGVQSQETARKQAEA